jgi:hypothetical protein
MFGFFVVVFLKCQSMSRWILISNLMPRVLVNQIKNIPENIIATIPLYIFEVPLLKVKSTINK